VRRDLDMIDWLTATGERRFSSLVRLATGALRAPVVSRSTGSKEVPARSATEVRVDTEARPAAGRQELTRATALPARSAPSSTCPTVSFAQQSTTFALATRSCTGIAMILGADWCDFAPGARG
jgi:hypothetical protein